MRQPSGTWPRRGSRRPGCSSRRPTIRAPFDGVMGERAHRPSGDRVDEETRAHPHRCGRPAPAGVHPARAGRGSGGSRGPPRGDPRSALPGRELLRAEVYFVSPDPRSPAPVASWSRPGCPTRDRRLRPRSVRRDRGRGGAPTRRPARSRIGTGPCPGRRPTCGVWARTTGWSAWPVEVGLRSGGQVEVLRRACRPGDRVVGRRRTQGERRHARPRGCAAGGRRAARPPSGSRRIAQRES